MYMDNSASNSSGKSTLSDNPTPHYHLSTLRGLFALSPVLLFMGLYLSVSLATGDFYAMPVSVAFVAASAWALMTLRGRSLAERVEVFSRGAARGDILYMVWVYIMAGAFASLAKGCGAIDATVALALRYLPADFILPGLFGAACFISLAIGSSVGTVVALTPLAASIATAGEGNVALFVAAVLGGAFFGDNLSFISDTTIAATRSQGIGMRDKFRANLRVVLPAAVISLVLYFFLGKGEIHSLHHIDGNWPMVIPYLLVIGLALSGMNVIGVLGCGIAAALGIGLWQNHTLLSLVGYLGTGITDMGELTIITILAAGMLGVIQATGGIDWMLRMMTRRVTTPRGARFVISALVSMVNLCTANNTVAIITVGTLSRDISRRYALDPARVASILDTWSCIVQSLIPYGAQALLAASLSSISPVAPFPYLFYPFLLATTMILVLILLPSRHRRLSD